MSQASRRNFLKFGAAAFAGATLGGPNLAKLLAADAAADASQYGGLVMGIQSYSLRDRSFDKMLEAMKNDLKLHAVEIFPGHLAGTTPPQAMEKLKAHDVVPMSYGVIPFGKDEKANRKHFDLAKTFGLKSLSCDPDDSPETFASLEKLTEEYGIPVGIHPHGPGHKWGSKAQLDKAFEGRSNRIGLCADTGHLIRSGEDPVKICEAYKDRLHELHLKDFAKTEKDGKTDWKDVPASEGSLDVDALVKLLMGMNFKGGVFIEYEGNEPVAAIQKSLARVAEAVKKAKA